MSKIYKSAAIWNHKPTEQELIDNLEPKTDAIVRELPPQIADVYLQAIGSTITYNGIDSHPIYYTEVFYRLKYPDREPICYIDLSQIELKE